MAVWVGEAGPSDAAVDQVHTVEEGKVRGREAILYRDGKPVARLLDLPWGEDDPTHWQRTAQLVSDFSRTPLSRAARANARVLLAGGLGPENVAAAIAAVRPWAVDASSSLEVSPGIKDHARVRAYVEAARS